MVEVSAEVGVPEIMQVVVLIVAHAGSAGLTLQLETAEPFDKSEVGATDIAVPNWPLVPAVPEKSTVGTVAATEIVTGDSIDLPALFVATKVKVVEGSVVDGVPVISQVLGLMVAQAGSAVVDGLTPQLEIEEPPVERVEGFINNELLMIAFVPPEPA